MVRRSRGCPAKSVWMYIPRPTEWLAGRPIRERGRYEHRRAQAGEMLVGRDEARRECHRQANPVSCLLFPFMGNTGQALGLAFMKTFFRTLYFEAQRLQRPIVYMLHPEDLYPWRETPEQAVFRWTDLRPSSSHGFLIRRALYETDPAKVARLSQALVD